MVDKPDYLSRAQTRRSFLATTGVATATALAGCGGDVDDGGDGGGGSLEMVSDITDGTKVSPTPSGSGTAPALELALDIATDEADYERVSYTYNEQGNAMNDNQLDAGVGTLMNFSIVPGWLQDTAGTVDNLRVLDVSDETREAWESEDRLLIQDADTSVIENADTPGELACPTFAYNFVCRSDLEYDTVYSLLEAMYEQREELADYHGILGTFEDDEFFVENAYDGVPFHPAAADFYEEIGVWSDEFERADDESSGGGDGETVRMRTSTSETTAYAANQGIASAVNDQTDAVNVEAQTSSGTEENIGALDSEDAEMVYVQNWSARQVREGEGVFSELDFEMTQVFHFYDLPWFFVADAGSE